ncbi:hypothetical protein M0811_09125 [Anaeramoeba ignava]|uniref:Thioredoxin-like fold domain-containing protein n=1 Tax=Anaeramoeba ignava TaxID=1746090 RepID=A0A9Q0RAX0_ANAIG|nr:hypothetical protein M0811_09125 [Anaeramoeba ignava]|eukprot:Anaeramoba_ignava/a478729_71.p1 GENE.a478729_71~~a478729_71.p1  ORF type:complete len:237 (+),score=65.35 a478729_71:72-713(+)
MNKNIYFIFFLISIVFSQAPIPKRPDGHKQGDINAPVYLEMFCDLLCPDCAHSWPTIKNVLEYYGSSKIYFIFHVFPLPYHTSAFFMAEASLVLENYTQSLFWDLLDSLYIDSKQQMFWDDAVENTTLEGIKSLMGSYLLDEFGLPNSYFWNGMNDVTIDWNSRVSWKYACTRGVSGTPTFMVNGVYVAMGSDSSLNDWINLLNPLFLNKPIY